MAETAWPFRNGTLARPMRWQLPFVAAVLEHDRVVLSAPTGAGKTAAALAPFVAGRAQGFADRCLYALPMRVLARSLYEEYAPHLRDVGLHATLQMGGSATDPDFRGQVVFTTIDQLLSRYLMAPYGGRAANISAGALVGAHIVLDEFHLYPEDEARLTAIAMLDHLRGASPAVVMTATLPEGARGELASLLGAHVTAVTTEEMDASGDRPRPLRGWTWREEALDAAAAMAAWRRAGQPDHVLVCVNTVARAQALYEALQAKSVLVHARFLPRHRDAHEITARTWLGRSSEPGPRWVVATQVIEAGLDASADLLLTEIAPAASLVQRAGRCARWKRHETDPVPIGNVVVFRDPRATSWLPYPLADIEAAWAAREDVEPAGGAAFEARLVERAHGAGDLESMRRLRGRLGGRREQCFRAIDSPDPSTRWQLIRNVSSQSVIVTDRPEDVRLDEVPEVVSVAATSLRVALMKPETLASARIPVFERADEAGGSYRRTAEPARWEAPSSIDAALAAPLLTLSPKTANYAEDVGLVLGAAGAGTPIAYRLAGAEAMKRFSYVQDSFEEHLERCITQTGGFLQASMAARKRLAALSAVPVDTVDAAARLAVALHDAGKLTVGWQAWAADWQRTVHGKARPECLAHTDFDPSDAGQRTRSKAVKTVRPSHAVEGAILARDAIARWTDDANIADEDIARALERAVIAAVARHHSVTATAAKPCRADPRSRACVQRVLQCAGIAIALASPIRDVVARGEDVLDVEDLPSAFGHRRGALEVLLYWHIARITRLADRHSFDPIDPPKVSP